MGINQNDKKVVLVTGSARGIGAAIIRELAKCGYDCIINYHTSEKAAYILRDEVISKYNIKAIAIKADISNEEEVNEMFSIIEKEFGTLSCLINNAAIDIPKVFESKRTQDFKRVMDVNVIGAYIVSRKASKLMLKNKWGRIINISSTNGINTYYPMCLEYDASKAALISLTHNLSIQFAPYITVNAIAPGFIGTEAELIDYDKEFIEEEVSKILLRRPGKPEEVSNLVKFLLSDEASYINNTVIRIDGGQYGS